MARKKSGTFKVGREAKKRKFIPVKQGERRKKALGSMCILGDIAFDFKFYQTN
ncbi:hypothetical protein KAR48_19475 [bacterium]|nr:hypothetical protein [bacterium]